MAKSNSNLTILIVQTSAPSLDKKENIEQLGLLVEKGISEQKVDFIVFPELAATPYFCRSCNKNYFDLAEPIPGPTTAYFSQLASQHKVNIIVPLFEKGHARGEFYNATALINRSGELVSGCLPNGASLSCYRKCHIPAHYNTVPPNNEKYFFRPGPGFPIFKINGVTVGCLICYDRSFPEAWRMLALQNAELVFVVAASGTSYRQETYFYELRTAAMQNGVFIVACNKGGKESLEGTDTTFFGLSCVIDPFGNVLAQAPSNRGSLWVTATINLKNLDEYDKHYHYMRDRRPELYSEIAKAIVT